MEVILYFGFGLWYDDFYINIMDFYPDEVLNLISSIELNEFVNITVWEQEEPSLRKYGFTNITLQDNNNVLELFNWLSLSNIFITSEPALSEKNATFHIYELIHHIFLVNRKDWFVVLFNINFIFVKFIFFKVNELTFWLLPQLLLFFGGLLSFLLIKTNDLNIKIWNLTRIILIFGFFLQVLNTYIYYSFYLYGINLKVGLDSLLTISSNIYFGKLILFLLVFLVLYISTIFLQKNYSQTLFLIKPELCSLILFLGFGVGMVFLQNDLFSIFLYLELISFCIYGFLFLHQWNNAQLHGLIWYVLFSLWMASFYVLGVSFYLSWTNFNTNLSYFKTSNIYTIWTLMEDTTNEQINLFMDNPELILSITFLIIYFLFKLGAGPFYTWVIDVYNSCSTGVLLAVSVIPKLVYIPVLVYLLYYNFLFFYKFWTDLLFVIGLSTVFIGATSILVTDKLKEIYAWSSVVHTGNILILISCITFFTIPFCFFYLISYTIISFGFITIIISLKNKSTGRFIKTIYDLNSINYLYSTFTIASIIIVSSAVGFTPLLSFFMKFSVFSVISSQYGIFFAILVGILNVIGSVAYLKMLWNIIGHDMDDFLLRKKAKPFTKLSLYIDYWIAVILNISCIIICLAFFFYKEFLPFFYFNDEWYRLDYYSNIIFIKPCYSVDNLTRLLDYLETVYDIWQGKNYVHQNVNISEENITQENLQE